MRAAPPGGTGSEDRHPGGRAIPAAAHQGRPRHTMAGPLRAGATEAALNGGRAGEDNEAGRHRGRRTNKKTLRRKETMCRLLYSSVEYFICIWAAETVADPEVARGRDSLIGFLLAPPRDVSWCSVAYFVSKVPNFGSQVIILLKKRHFVFF